MIQDHGDRKAHERRGEVFWRRTLKKQRKSGLTQKEYCRRNKLSRATFQRWRGKLKMGSSGVEALGQPEFVKVEVRPQVEPAERHDGFELIFKSGLRLKLPSLVDGRALVEVLRALEVTGSC